MKLNNMVRITTVDKQTWLVKRVYFKESDLSDEYPGMTFEYSPEATALELINLIDSDLESANFHSLCGLARKLYDLVKEVSDESIANKFIEKLYDNSMLQDL